MHPGSCGFTGGEIMLALGSVAIISLLAGAGLMAAIYGPVRLKRGPAQ